MKYQNTGIALLLALFVVGFAGPVCFAKNIPPLKVNLGFEEIKETRLRELKPREVKEVMAELKKPEFLFNDKFLQKGVYVSLGHRKKTALNHAIDELRRKRVTTENGQVISRSDELYVAKKILQVFAGEAMPRLIQMFDQNPVTVKINIVQCLGTMPGDDEVESLLLRALDDTEAPEDEEQGAEAEGMPLRVCDEAYNQLMLRHAVPDSLRTLGPSHSIEQRDEHIAALKIKLSA